MLVFLALGRQKTSCGLILELQSSPLSLTDMVPPTLPDATSPNAPSPFFLSLLFGRIDFYSALCASDSLRCLFFKTWYVHQE